MCLLLVIEWVNNHHNTKVILSAIQTAYQTKKIVFLGDDFFAGSVIRLVDVSLTSMKQFLDETLRFVRGDHP